MAERPRQTHFDSSSSVNSAASSCSSSVSSPSPRYSMESPPIASVEILRCLRCAKCVEITTTDDPASTGMVQIGFNIHYCSSCAKIVGFK